jgi:glycosyltransferase involved in cell wall biosynthesis
MRILILASTFPRFKNDKVPEFVLDFAKSISKKAEVIVLAPHDQNSAFKERMENVTVYRFPYFLPGYQTLAYRGGMVNRFKESLLAKIQLPFYLLALFFYTLILSLYHNIDVINAHWIFPQGFIARIVQVITGKKLIITTHGGDVAILNKPKIRTLLQSALRNADKVTYVTRKNSEYVVSQLGENLRKNSILMPMGIYLPAPFTKALSTQIEVLFIGRLVAIKGVDILLKAFAEAQKTNPNLHLTLLGDGPLRGELERLTVAIGIKEKVDFKGYITGSEKDTYLKNTDIVAISSIIDEHGYQEGLPVVALEAMAYGKVLIATKTGGLPELINDRNGILVEQNDVKDLALKLKGVASDSKKREEISRHARETAAAYSWDKISARFFDSITTINKSVLILSLGDKASGPTTWKNGLKEILFRKGVAALEVNSTSLSSLGKISLLFKTRTVHAFHVSPASLIYMLLAKVFGKKVIFTVHGDIFSEDVSKTGLKKVFWLPFNYFALNVADKITFPSFFIYSKITERLPHHIPKSIVIHNGIDIGGVPERNYLSNIQVLSITNFNYFEKARGIELLINAINKLREKYKELTLSIIGSGKHFDEFRSKHESPHIHFLGFRNNVPEFLDKSSLYVHASLLDNFPYSVLEAVKHGVPTLAVKVGAIHEMLPEDAQLETNIKHIQSKIEALLLSAEKRKHLALANLQFIKKFDWDNVGTEFINLYD